MSGNQVISRLLKHGNDRDSDQDDDAHNAGDSPRYYKQDEMEFKAAEPSHAIRRGSLVNGVEVSKSNGLVNGFVDNEDDARVVIDPSGSKIVYASGMKLFGRRWNFAAEDTAVPSFCESFLNFVFFVFLLIIILLKPFSNSVQREMFESYTVYSFIVHLILLVLDFGIIQQSCATGLFKENRKLITVLYFRIVMLVAQLALALWGSVRILFASLYENSHVQDEKYVNVVFFSIVIFSWIELSAALCFSFCVFNYFGSDKFEEEVDEETWAQCCRTLLCQSIRFGNGLNMDDQDFLHIAKLLRKLFRDVRGLVLTDIVAGMALLHAYQVLKPNLVYEVVVGSDGNDISREEEKELETEDEDENKRRINLLTQYMKYASASYGAGHYSVSRPCRACFLCCSPHMCSCICGSPEIDVGSDFCGCTKTAFLRGSERVHEDLIFCNLNASFGTVVFFVTFEHETKSIVIAIRGTFSVAEAIIDADVDSMDLSPYGYPGHHAHKGIASAAIRLRDTIEKSSRFLQFQKRHPDYSYKVVGHSLGGGTAIMLTLLLLKDPDQRYHDIQCITYGAPPVLDHALACDPQVIRHVTGLIHGYDCVPTLSFSGVLLLKSQILFLLTSYIKYHQEHPHLPPPRKWNILLSLSLSLVSSASEKRMFTDFFDSQHIHDGMVNIVKNIEAVEKRPFIAGKIYHVEKMQLLQRLCGNCICYPKNAFIDPVVRPVEREDFLEINVSRRMLFDHMPWEYEAIFEALKTE